MRVKNAQYVGWLDFEWYGGDACDKGLDRASIGIVCTIEFANNLRYWYVAKAKHYYGGVSIPVKGIFFTIENQYDCQQMRVEKCDYYIWWTNFTWECDDVSSRPVDDICYGLVCTSIISGGRTYIYVSKAGLRNYGRNISASQLFFIIENQIVVLT